MNPGKVYLSDEEYAEMIEKIKANLQLVYSNKIIKDI